MLSEEEDLFESLSRVINICQEIHNDSRTPLDDAIALTTYIRKLVEYKRTLREKAFKAATANAEYINAVNTLKVLNDTVKADVLAHGRTMEFIQNTAQAVAAVLDLAIAVGAIAA